MESVELHNRAQECLFDFETLVLVEPATENCRNSDDLNCEEQKARFSIWSANIGIFADGHASLDYRLRNSLEAKELMLDLLGSLKNYLRRAAETIRHMKDNELSFSHTHIEDGLSSVGSRQTTSASSVFPSSYQGSETDDSLSIPVDQDRTPFEQRVHGIEQTIDRLYRLSVAIRRPSIISQNAKAVNIVIRDEDGTDVSQQFTDFALNWITHHFREAPLTLRERLAKSVTLRRKRFLYRQSHQLKLGAKATLTPSPQLKRPDSLGLDAESTIVARTVVDGHVHKNQNRRNSLPKAVLPSQTSASRVSDKFRTDDVFETTPCKTPTVFSGAFIQQGAVSIPDPPKAVLPWYKKRSQGSAANLFTECPLCGYGPPVERINTLINSDESGNKQKQDHSRIVSEDIVEHLAGHLHMISIKALPWRENVEEELSEKAASKKASEGHESNDDRASQLATDLNILLVFDDDPQAVQDVEWQHIDPAAADHGVIWKSCNTYETYTNEWGFIQNSQYYGHDRDPILQKLLKRLYLSSSSVTGKHTDLVLPIYMMPPIPLNKHFFGREYVLKAIATELVPEAHAKPANGKAVTYPLTFTVCAPGGMGKTQVAIQFALAHQKSFEVILWVNADSVNEMAQGFQRIAGLLGLIPKDSMDGNDLIHTREVVKRWLVNPPSLTEGRKSRRHISWLIIYDGVQDPDILNDFWPYDGPGSVLITSRNPFSWTKSLPLKQFTSDEAVAFLLKLTNRELSDVDRESVTKVGSRLGGLPLALTQMASIIVTKQLSFRQFLDSYNERDSQRELLQFQTHRIYSKSPSHEHTVASVWAFENLRYGRKLLNVLSMLDPDSIPERLLTSSSGAINLPGYPATITDYENARGELLACSLVTANKQENKLFIHRLVQDVARAEMTLTELRKTFVACVKLVASVWPFEDFTWRHGIARWPVCEEVFPHISRLKDIFSAIRPSAPTSDDYHFARILTDTGWYLHERGRLIDTNLYNNMAQSICESLKFQLYEPSDLSSSLGVTHSELDFMLAELYHNRGIIACGASDATEGLRNLKIFHDMMEKEFEKDTPRTDMRLGLAFNQLGFAYMLKEDWPQGEVHFLRSIELLEMLDDYEPTLISLPIVNLGYSYWLQGRLDEAAAVLRKGVGDREQKFGIHDRISFISGRFYHALGNVTYDQGLTEESFGYHHKALLHFKATLGNNHHLTASVFVKVAEHNIRASQYDTAIALLDHALKSYSISNNYLSEKARVSFKLSNALTRLRKFDEADIELRKCFQVYSDQVAERTFLTGKPRIVKTRKEDLTDKDFDDLVAFWFK
ncbi:uncharacterized protein RAG0_14884 [Rhynchosporium agropyri]|uniref:DUF7779 domain-containing protein n=1 Tax=Rhynchosporium agropyri TaxID=914238 RepID=A0A1E1LIQ9_9HELO|nr:uncharacterized protein RAG0_14884 [Rhynchosporium agropyri]